MPILKEIDGRPIEEFVPYTLSLTSKLSGVSERRLRAWDSDGILIPSSADENRKRPFSRFYQLRDIVAARAIDHFSMAAPAEELRRIQPWINANMRVPWSRLRLKADDRQLVLESADSLEVRNGASDTLTSSDSAWLHLDSVVGAVQAKIEELGHRNPMDIGRITRNRYVMRNSWIVAGTRVPTDSIWQMRQEGFSDREILEQFPQITDADIVAAIEHETGLRRKGAA